MAHHGGFAAVAGQQQGLAMRADSDSDGDETSLSSGSTGLTDIDISGLSLASLPRCRTATTTPRPGSSARGPRLRGSEPGALPRRPATARATGGRRGAFVAGSVSIERLSPRGAVGRWVAAPPAAACMRCEAPLGAAQVHRTLGRQARRCSSTTSNTQHSTRPGSSVAVVLVVLWVVLAQLRLQYGQASGLLTSSRLPENTPTHTAARR